MKFYEVKHNGSIYAVIRAQKTLTFFAQTGRRRRCRDRTERNENPLASDLRAGSDRKESQRDSRMTKVLAPAVWDGSMYLFSTYCSKVELNDENRSFFPGDILLSPSRVLNGIEMRIKASVIESYWARGRAEGLDLIKWDILPVASGWGVMAGNGCSLVRIEEGFGGWKLRGDEYEWARRWVAFTLCGVGEMNISNIFRESVMRELR